MARFASSLLGVLLIVCCSFSQDVPILPKVIPGVLRIRNWNKQPTKVVKPTYPPEASKRWIQGTVVLDVVIGKNGNVEMVGFEDDCCASSPTILARTAADAVRQWRWQPIMLNEKPTRVRTKVSVNFVMNETSPPISVCTVLRNPAYYNGRTVNVSGTVKYDGELKLLTSAVCSGSVVVADQSENSGTVRDERYLAFEKNVSSSPVSACVRGLFQEDNGPGELKVQRLILERVLDCPT